MSVEKDSVLNQLSDLLDNSSITDSEVNEFRAESIVMDEYISEIEQMILRSENPIEVDETQEIAVVGQQGIWLNKIEEELWDGDLNEYGINEDSEPEVINKESNLVLEYVQELAIRYLRPPTPEPAGDIVITQEPDIAVYDPAPPLIIRQAAPRAETPEPLVIREAPPEPPKTIGVKKITISGKVVPPPPRKVVIERLPPMPAKPQNVIVERWLPYNQGKRRVVFNKAQDVSSSFADQKNLIIQWQAPEANIRQEVKYLDVIKADPKEYIEAYGQTLKNSTNLPQFVLDIPTPEHLGDLNQDNTVQLEGDLEAMQFINLDDEGLAEYRDQLLSQGIKDLGIVTDEE